MPVDVTLLGPLRELAETGSVRSDASTVGDLLSELSRRYGRSFAKRAKAARVLVNGSAVQFGRGKKTPLSDGDEVALVFPVGGG